MIKEFKSINKKMIENDNFSIYCPDDLKYFSFELVDYLDNNLGRLKSFFNIKNVDNIMIDLHSDKELVKDISPYPIEDFSGFFNNNGVFCYIDLNGRYDKSLLKSKVCHELVHHLYANYVEDRNSPRVTWLDEGMAMNLSGDHDYLKDDQEFINFLNNRILNISQRPVMNNLKHGREFINKDYNGYALSYLSVRYMLENYSHDKFLSIIKNKSNAMLEGETVLEDAVDYYCNKFNLSNSNKVR